MSIPWTNKQLERFWSKVHKGAADECWQWIGPVASHGYGRFTRGRKWEETSHRISWEFVNGPIPKGQVIRHTCDNRRCVNPAHMELGHQRENVRDVWIRRRRSTKLTIEQAREIRERALSGPRGIGQELAAEFGCSVHTVSNIKLGKQWLEEYHYRH